MDNYRIITMSVGLFNTEMPPKFKISATYISTHKLKDSTSH